MFKIHRNTVMLIFVLYAVHSTKASYSSEETDEKSKSLYSVVTSILSSTDSSRHQHRRTYDGSPCTSNGCKLNSSPCSTPGGCSPSQQNYPTNIGNAGYSITPSYTNDGRGETILTGHGNYNLPQSIEYNRPSAYNYQSSHNGYNQPANLAPYPYWQGNSHQYGYQGPRGYSVYDHSLKINSEYTETGSHAGSLQQAKPGYGYGSGYGGGYNGLFNRPGF